MKAVLISIKPKWCEKIANGEKTIEVRKSAPKEVPFKAYIYETYDKKYDDIGICWGTGKHFEHKCKKVIGEFICDKISIYAHLKNLTSFNDMGLPCGKYDSYAIWTDEFKEMCLTWTEIENYGKGKTLYGWHISDLKIYDKPKELSEFFAKCRFSDKQCRLCDNCFEREDSYGRHYAVKKLTRPPQSWQYVEELESENAYKNGLQRIAE